MIFLIREVLFFCSRKLNLATVGSVQQTQKSPPSSEWAEFTAASTTNGDSSEQEKR